MTPRPRGKRDQPNSAENSRSKGSGGGKRSGRKPAGKAAARPPRVSRPPSVDEKPKKTTRAAAPKPAPAEKKPAATRPAARKPSAGRGAAAPTGSRGPVMEQPSAPVRSAPPVQQSAPQNDAPRGRSGPQGGGRGNGGGRGGQQQSPPPVRQQQPQQPVQKAPMPPQGQPSGRVALGPQGRPPQGGPPMQGGRPPQPQGYAPQQGQRPPQGQQGYPQQPNPSRSAGVPGQQRPPQGQPYGQGGQGQQGRPPQQGQRPPQVQGGYPQHNQQQYQQPRPPQQQGYAPQQGQGQRQPAEQQWDRQPNVQQGRGEQRPQNPQQPPRQSGNQQPGNQQQWNQRPTQGQGGYPQQQQNQQGRPSQQGGRPPMPPQQQGHRDSQGGPQQGGRDQDGRDQYQQPRPPQGQQGYAPQQGRPQQQPQQRSEQPRNDQPRYDQPRPDQRFDQRPAQQPPQQRPPQQGYVPQAQPPVQQQQPNPSRSAGVPNQPNPPRSVGAPSQPPRQSGPRPMPVMPMGKGGAAPQNFYQPSARTAAPAPTPPPPRAPVEAPSAPVQSRAPVHAPAHEPIREAAPARGPATSEPRVLPVHAVPMKVAGDRDTGDVFDKTARFADLGLSDAVLRGVTEAGFEFPTSIQAQIIPLLLTGRDMLGQAKTGTGKTAAFGLPMLSRLMPGDAMAGIVLVPTRELAIQVATDLNELGRYTGMTALPVYGGQNISTQADRLSRGPEIIVATPGRLMDMRERGYVRYENVKIAVLDEVDRMLDIGFRDDIKRILGGCPKDRQTVFVSATLPKEVESLARTFARDAQKIVATSGSLTATMVKQYHLPVEPWDKKQLLLHLLTHESPALTLVFCRTKKTVDNLSEYLNRKGIEAHAMHGDMQQSKRNSALAKLKSGALSVLIASDLASRGLDVEGITHVINYDLPEDPDLYVHRIGRTARAGRDGVAWALVTPEQGPLLTEIEMLINAEIPKLDYPDFKPGPLPDDVRAEREAAERRASGAKTFNRFASGPISAAPVPVAAAGEAPAVAAPLVMDASKFPGGIIPSKLPDKRLGGKVRSARSMRQAIAQAATPPAQNAAGNTPAPGAPAGDGT